MITKIQKWGNSLGLRIPRSFAKEARVEAGATVDLRVTHGRLEVRPVRPERYSLDELLAGVNPRNLHHEVETGHPKGKELL
ncbi:MAG TPA: AbrB/MazE/SpoVT family DNA-binding domain-containing protein [Planctomycetota bacterium]|nr:AbrB/MazE/SpoVT family DNA-binding domain-containing protein [Planctomycetota bacterium]